MKLLCAVSWEKNKTKKTQSIALNDTHQKRSLQQHTIQNSVLFALKWSNTDTLCGLS